MRDILQFPEVTLRNFLFFVGVAIALGSAIKVGQFAPANADVYANPATGLYVSPPCFFNGAFKKPLPHPNEYPDPNASGMILTNSKDAGGDGFKSDQICIDYGGFNMDMSVISATILGHPLLSKSRWNADGSWNW